jgi:hypothetical protein
MQIPTSFKSYFISNIFKYDLLLHICLLILVLSIIFLFVIQKQETDGILTELKHALNPYLNTTIDTGAGNDHNDDITTFLKTLNDNIDVNSPLKPYALLYKHITPQLINKAETIDPIKDKEELLAKLVEITTHPITPTKSFNTISSLVSYIITTYNDPQSGPLTVKDIIVSLKADPKIFPLLDRIFNIKHTTTFWYNKNINNTVILLIIIVVLILFINFYSAIKNKNITPHAFIKLIVENLLTFLLIGMVEMIFFVNVGLKYKAYTNKFVIETINNEINYLKLNE